MIRELLEWMVGVSYPFLWMMLYIFAMSARDCAKERERYFQETLRLEEKLFELRQENIKLKQELLKLRKLLNQKERGDNDTV